MSPFELIGTEAADHSIQRLCRLLGVSRSGYYDYLSRLEQPPVTPRVDRLIALIRAVHAAYEGAYGVRRMHRELLEAGENVSRKLVRRLMREHGIRSVHTRRFRKTTDSNHELGFALRCPPHDAAPSTRRDHYPSPRGAPIRGVDQHMRAQIGPK